jgi:endonuclease YncB( thermonuclease family)
MAGGFGGLSKVCIRRPFFLFIVSLLFLVYQKSRAASFIATTNFSTLQSSPLLSSVPLFSVTKNDESLDDASRRHLIGTVAVLTALTIPTAAVLSVGPNPLVRFDTVDRIPPSYFDRHVRLYAYTERVIDGDTIRVRHVPGYNWPLIGGNAPPEDRKKNQKKKRGIADETLILRLYGVDCPELSKKSSVPPQPFALEAKEFTTSQVYHQMVVVTLLNKDRYGRAIAMVETVPSSPLAAGTDLSIELARQGLSQLYTGGGAEYNVRHVGVVKRSLCF